MKAAIIFLTFLFIASTATTFSQGMLDQNISWSTDKNIEVGTGKMTVEPNRIITYKKDKVEWLDARGNVKLSLPIKTTSGNWADANVIGEMTYQVQATEQRTGTVTVRRTASGAFITFVLPGAGQAPPFFWELTVTVSKPI